MTTEILHPDAIAEAYEKIPGMATGGFVESTEPALLHKPESMLKRPDVSVLIPAYNARITLRRAVESALNQEGVSVQVVIADDTSTDGTLGIAYDLGSQPKNIPGAEITIVPRYKNGRIAAALNSAGEAALGRYIIRLDSDDWYQLGCLERFVRALDSHPEVDFVYGARQYWGRRSDAYRPMPFNRADFDLHNAAGYCYLFRRKIWDDGLRWRALGTFGGRVIDLEDWQHLQAMLAQGCKGMALPEVLALHHVLRWDGTWGELKNVEAEALAEFKRLWPNVIATQL